MMAARNNFFPCLSDSQFLFEGKEGFGPPFSFECLYLGLWARHWPQFGEQLASISTSPSIRIIEACISGASCNRKDQQVNKKVKHNT